MLGIWGLPGWEDEVDDVVPGRLYRFDIVNRQLKISIEIQGGIFQQKNKAHNTINGRLRDMDKSNLAQVSGWIALQFTPTQFDSGAAVEVINKAIRWRSNPV